jgi:hypothetical protein
MVPAISGTSTKATQRFDAEQEKRASRNFSSHRQVGEEPGDAERLEIFHGAGGREHLALEPRMGEEHERERDAQKQRGVIDALGREALARRAVRRNSRLG